jgi:hypothetical protein
MNVLTILSLFLIPFAALIIACCRGLIIFLSFFLTEFNSCFFLSRLSFVPLPVWSGYCTWYKNCFHSVSYMTQVCVDSVTDFTKQVVKNNGNFKKVILSSFCDCAA